MGGRRKRRISAKSATDEGVDSVLPTGIVIPASEEEEESNLIILKRQRS